MALIACAPAAAAPSPSPSPAVTSATASLAAAAAFVMPTDRDMITFAADHGALIAFSTKDSPPPYESKVQRADPTTNTWRAIYTSDSQFAAGQVAAGRVALAEYRQPLPSGGGAYSVDFTIVDLATGTATAIDHFASTSATFRGGGGGPRRPVGSIVLGPDRAAWTRLIESPGGSVSGQLRVASLTAPAQAQVIGSSTEWIAPLGLDGHRLLYVVGGRTEDQLRIRDLETGADRIVATGAVGDPQREGVPGFNAAVLAGDQAIWLDTPRSAPGKIRAVNVVSGAERTIDAGGSSCSQASAGTRYVAWYCARVGTVIDARTLEPAREIPVGLAPEASDDAVLWFTLVGDGRTISLFRPG